MQKPFIVLLLSLVWLLTACESSTGQVLAPEAFQAQLASQPEAQLIDVRAAPEVAQGKLAEAVNIDVRQADFETHLAELNRDKPVFLYCRSGRRSAYIVGVLEEMGFWEVYDLRGGILAWQQARLPINKSD